MKSGRSKSSGSRSRRVFSPVAGCVAVTLVLLWTGVAAGHAYLQTADPAEDAVVRTPPREVRLAFSEPIEVRFSTFKIYPLRVESGWDIRRLNGAAGLLVSEVLLKRDDEALRVDAGLASAPRTSAHIVLRVRADLRSGAYVVMWRVLSIDTHTTQGFYVFTYAPR
jgi:methionine-rich copper-binding protein CopC